MASLDKCIRELQSNGIEKLESLLITLKKFYRKVHKLENIKVLSKDLIGNNDVFDFDVCKIVILSKVNQITGKALEEELREQYGFEMEMTSEKYVLAMTTMNDDMEQILNLADALEKIDNNLKKVYPQRVFTKERDMDNEEKISKTIVAMPIYEAKRKESEEVFFIESEGKVSAGYIYVYPPEIPLVVPGETLSKNIIEQIDYYKKINLNVKGIENGKIRVII